MELVNRIRDNQKKGMDVKTAVDAAVDSCIADGIMETFLKKHKAEVLSVCITEFDEEVFTKGIREEGRDEGIADTKKKTALKLLKRGKLTVEEIAEDTGLSVAEVEQLAGFQRV